MTMMRSILVATDLTAASDEVLRAGAALSALTGAELHVIHAFDFQTLPYSEDGLQHVSFHGRIYDAEDRLTEQLRRAVPPSTEVVSQEVLIGRPHRVILERARATGAELLVLGPHRRLPLGDAILGSTADRVVRTADAPCLVVRGPLSMPLRRVLVPIDLSDPALGALDTALRWSAALRPSGGDEPFASTVTVLHMIPRIFNVEDFPFDRAVIGPELHKEVEAAVARVSQAKTLDVQEEVRWGDTPAEEILRAAEEERTDLVVMATHGYGALKRALIGSVASAVARGAKCPVLLVPPALWAGASDSKEADG